MTKTVNLSDLELGDVIDLGFAPYGCATVRKINDDGSVQVLRPYVVCADFSYTGGVPTSLGFEDFALHGASVVLLEKGRALR